MNAGLNFDSGVFLFPSADLDCFRREEDCSAGSCEFGRDSERRGSRVFRRSRRTFSRDGRTGITRQIFCMHEPKNQHLKIRKLR
ncbi:uncharacterized protein LOC116845164 isoform X2 [Odontomachus brunneus]|uniref:uncharacterized protein LOC116845164 isoform X2 n=1 Tax=Odontomachus brunneus TaxID=486640 RepID=UPI0013F2A064|nr:uncharacterized protein LOC116845164 isoform X2 [Odontomachus brunneus]